MYMDIWLYDIYIYIYIYIIMTIIIHIYIYTYTHTYIYIYNKRIDPVRAPKVKTPASRADCRKQNGRIPSRTFDRYHKWTTNHKYNIFSCGPPGTERLSIYNTIIER